MACVYRHRNAAFVQRLMGQCGDLSLHVVLWALDRPHPGLEPFTVGSGPGGKFDLVNAMLSSGSVPAGEHLVVADDDVVLARGDLRRLIDVVKAAGFGLAQPAHARHSYATFPVTRRRRLSIARLGNFVEIGPLFVVAPEWRSRVVPFPEGVGLGWGLDLRWMALADEGCSLGVVDRVTLRHCRPIGGGYDTTTETARLRQVLAQLAVADDAPLLDAVTGLQRDTATWRPWHRRPPWRPTP